MIQAADRGEVGEVLTEGLNRRLKKDAVKLFKSGDKWSETRAGRRSMQKQLRGAEWGLRWEVAVQTEETVRSEHHDAGHMVQVVGLQQEVQGLKKRSEMREMMLRDSNGRIEELDTIGRGDPEKRDRATQAGLWGKKAAEQAGEGGNGHGKSKSMPMQTRDQRNQGGARRHWGIGSQQQCRNRNAQEQEQVGCQATVEYD